jgi:hypothetical protein
MSFHQALSNIGKHKNGKKLPGRIFLENHDFGF